MYKKVGQAPEVKIISDVFKLKKAIVENNLEMIPYENLLLICNCQKSISNEKTNIVLTFRSVKGDLILVDFDKDKRELKGLSQEDVIWYTKDLMNKSAIDNDKNRYKKITTNKIRKYYEKQIQRDDDTTSSSFETSLIKVLIDIEQILSTLLKNIKNGDMKNES